MFIGKYKSVQWLRTDTVVMEDARRISARKYHRHALSPDAVITDEHTEVQAVCNAVWHIYQVKAAYEAFKSEQQDN